MKNLSLLIAVIACLLPCFNARAQYSETVKEGPFVEGDTTFIRKVYHTGPNTYDNYSDNLWVERNHESETYRDYLYSGITFDDYLQTLVIVPSIFTQCDTLAHIGYDNYSLVGEYVPLFRYKGEYYLYRPTQWHVKRMIMPNFVVYDYLDGLYPRGMFDFKKVGPSSFRMRVIDGNLYGETSPVDMEIYVIDEKRGIILWRELYGGGEKHDVLFVDVRRASAFDMIVWDTMELQDEATDIFETPDYEEIIRLGRLL